MTTDLLLTKIRRRLLKVLRHEWRIPEFASFDYSSEYAMQNNLFIKELIENDTPFFAGRFGTVELGYYLRGEAIMHHEKNIIKSLLGAPICWPIQEQSGSLTFQAGVFPYTNQTLLDFCSIYRQAVDNLDVLITWVKDEKYLYKLGGGKK